MFMLQQNSAEHVFIFITLIGKMIFLHEKLPVLFTAINKESFHFEVILKYLEEAVGKYMMGKHVFVVLFFFNFIEVIFMVDKIVYITPEDEGGVCNVDGNILEPCLPLTNQVQDILTSDENLDVKFLLLPGEYYITNPFTLSASNVHALRLLPYNGRNIAIKSTTIINITCAEEGIISMDFYDIYIDWKCTP